MIALQIAVDVLMDLTIVHSRASGDPRASHCSLHYDVRRTVVLQCAILKH